GEERVVHVNLPPNYALSRHRYPVTYLLDGHVRQFFDVTVASAAYDLGSDGFAIPQQIVVGVDHPDRGQDLGKNQVAFTKFLVEELVPFIDREFRTTPYRTLIGHSLGGRFALMTFCRAPGVFPAVIAISAAGGDSASASSVDQCLTSAFASRDTTLRQLVLSAGENESRLLGGMKRVTALLTASAPKHWRWTVIDGPGLGHSETPLATIPPGIHFIYDASIWEMPRARADSIAVAPASDIESLVAGFYTQLSARVGSTVAPSLKWMLAVARRQVRGGTAESAEAAVRRVVDEYPEDLEAYGMLSELAMRRGDRPAARRALVDARRMLDKLDIHDVYEHERKRKILDDMLAALGS
ncbi:MAG: alpha/beta hydrolase-fold protein, partial [Gemmatimonadaceae bacterium]